MKNRRGTTTTRPFPRARRLMVDGGRMARRRHTVHGLVEFDITRAQHLIRRLRSETGQALSFTGFFLWCLGTAIDENKEVHAYRDWRGRFVIFDDVDVNMLFEVEVDGGKTVRPHIIRGVNTKSLSEIHEEIREFQSTHLKSDESAFIDRFVRLPGFLRRVFLRILFRSPSLIKDLYGTVLVSSIGTFGSGNNWAIPAPNHTLQLTLGGIAQKPGVTEGRIAIRKFLSVTVSFDHDIVDGAPMARFTQRLKKLVEDRAGLSLSEPESSPPSVPTDPS